MNNASLELGGTNWAEKDGNILGYSVGDTSGKYFPQEFTFARGSNLAATRIGKTGLIEKGRENLLLQSNQFDTTWVLTNAPTLTSGQAGYDGSNDAWKLEASTTGSSRSIHQVVSSSGFQVFSVYVKAGTTDWIRINLSGVGNRYFDIGNGVVGGSGSMDGFITDVGGGWYRCSVLGNGSSTAPYVFLASDNGNLSVNAGDYIYIQDAQLEQGLVATDVISTTTTTAQAGVLENTPRLNYTTGVANPYLLLEPSRTNSVTSSETFGSTGWTNFVTGTAITTIVTDNFAISPDGTKNAQRIQFNLGGGTTASDRTVIRQSITSQTNWVLSVYMKSTDGTDQKILWHTGGDSNETVVTGEWKRYTFNLNGITNSWVGLAMRGTVSTNNTSDILVYGFQAEQGSYPTSYIPTYSVSATRAADSCYKTGISSLIGQTEGTLFIEFEADENIPQNMNLINFNNSTQASVLIAKRVTGQIRAQIFAAGVSALDINSVAVSGTTKVAFGYKSGDSVLYVNGVAFSNSSTFTFNGTLSEVKFPANEAYFNYGHKYLTSQALVFNTRLSDSDLATLTTL